MKKKLKYKINISKSMFYEDDLTTILPVSGKNVYLRAIDHRQTLQNISYWSLERMNHNGELEEIIFFQQDTEVTKEDIMDSPVFEVLSKCNEIIGNNPEFYQDYNEVRTMACKVAKETVSWFDENERKEYYHID